MVYTTYGFVLFNIHYSLENSSLNYVIPSHLLLLYLNIDYFQFFESFKVFNYLFIVNSLSPVNCIIITILTVYVFK